MLISHQLRSVLCSLHHPVVFRTVCCLVLCTFSQFCTRVILVMWLPPTDRRCHPVVFRTVCCLVLCTFSQFCTRVILVMWLPPTDRRCHRSYHEDAQNTESRSAGVRAVQPTQVSCQGGFLTKLVVLFALPFPGSSRGTYRCNVVCLLTSTPLPPFFLCVCVCACVCVRACVRVCVRACVRVYVRVCPLSLSLHLISSHLIF